jgi:hypothetical protein
MKPRNSFPRRVALGAACVILSACAHGVRDPAARTPAPCASTSCATASTPRADGGAGPSAAAAPGTIASTTAPSLPPLADAYRGRIGRGANIVVRLQTAPAGVTGRYFYETVGDALVLAGTTDDHGHIELTETTRSGGVTGSFKGDRLPTGAIEGTWQSASGGRREPFTLSPIARASGPGPVLVFKRAFRNRDRATDPIPPAFVDGRSTSCDIHVEYPEVFGLESADAEAKINEALSEEDERDCRQPCQGEVGYGITFNRDGVLGVDVGGEHMCMLAAHPSNYEGFSATFLTRTGERLGLERVFRHPFATYAKKLFQPAIRAMVQGTRPDGEQASASDPDANFYRDMLADAYASPDFVLIEGGVRFDIARHLPHAFQGIAADPTDLTFAQLKDALDPNSPIAFLWRK